jgi:hypothetical protein
MNSRDVWRVKAELAALPPGERNEALAEALSGVWRDSPDARRLTDGMRAVLLPRRPPPD